MFADVKLIIIIIILVKLYTIIFNFSTLAIFFYLTGNNGILSYLFDSIFLIYPIYFDLIYCICIGIEM